ncbi:MAG TPA: hypothetical protein VM536_14835, partial [Chloroflexia bacterium]|nr:hypothetical protein [Chloroflexia bacterium]
MGQVGEVPVREAAAVVGPPEPQRRVPRLRHLRGLRRVLQIAVIAVVFYYLGKSVWDRWPDIETYPWQVNGTYLVLALLVLIARGPIICFGWQRILAYMGYALPWKTAVRIYFYSGLAKYMPGSMWYAVGRVLLAE